LVRGSGDAALDAAAARAVQLSRFGPSDGGYRGMLRVVWGAGGTAP
jgi:outer membrane biosynthesis protein TonB